MSGDLNSNDLDAVQEAVDLLQSHGYRVEKIGKTLPEENGVYAELGISYPSRTKPMSAQSGDRVGWFVPVIGGNEGGIGDVVDLLDGPYMVGESYEGPGSDREAYELREVDR